MKKKIFKIAGKMTNSKPSSLPYEVEKKLKHLDQLCRRAGSKLKSKQLIALVVSQCTGNWND